MSKFGNLDDEKDEPFRVVLIDPKTDLPLKDNAGKEAYVDVLSSQSDAGRKFDKDQRAKYRRRISRGRSQEIMEDDQLDENIAKLAHLTVGWYLVDPVTYAAVDAPFSTDVAIEFYRLKKAWPFYMQAWLGANEAANFIKSASKSSSPSPGTPSATPAQ